jgi:hypothetical protein
MKKTEESTIRPILVWENSKANGGGQATVREIHTGAGTESTMPVIRIVSSGFGKVHAVQSVGTTKNQARYAA